MRQFWPTADSHSYHKRVTISATFFGRRGLSLFAQPPVADTLGSPELHDTPLSCFSCRVPLLACPAVQVTSKVCPQFVRRLQSENATSQASSQTCQTLRRAWRNPRVIERMTTELLAEPKSGWKPIAGFSLLGKPAVAPAVPAVDGQ